MSLVLFPGLTLAFWMTVSHFAAICPSSQFYKLFWFFVTHPLRSADKVLLFLVIIAELALSSCACTNLHTPHWMTSFYPALSVVASPECITMSSCWFASVIISLFYSWEPSSENCLFRFIRSAAILDNNHPKFWLYFNFSVRDWSICHWGEAERAETAWPGEIKAQRDFLEVFFQCM